MFTLKLVPLDDPEHDRSSENMRRSAASGINFYHTCVMKYGQNKVEPRKKTIIKLLT